MLSESCAPAAGMPAPSAACGVFTAVEDVSGSGVEWVRDSWVGGQTCATSCSYELEVAVRSLSVCPEARRTRTAISILFSPRFSLQVPRGATTGRTRGKRRTFSTQDTVASQSLAEPSSCFILFEGCRIWNAAVAFRLRLLAQWRSRPSSSAWARDLSGSRLMASARGVLRRRRSKPRSSSCRQWARPPRSQQHRCCSRSPRAGPPA